VTKGDVATRFGGRSTQSASQREHRWGAVMAIFDLILMTAAKFGAASVRVVGNMARRMWKARNRKPVEPVKAPAC
jgi:hypothetical protein